MSSIILFGEASKGIYEAAYLCNNLVELSDHLGEPPNEEARGLLYAIQMILYKYAVIFFRVHEEGYSTSDYLRGLQFLENEELFPEIKALCLPGIGNQEIVDATYPICKRHDALLLISEKDLYDYLTDH